MVSRVSVYLLVLVFVLLFTLAYYMPYYSGGFGKIAYEHPVVVEKPKPLFTSVSRKTNIYIPLVNNTSSMGVKENVSGFWKNLRDVWWIKALTQVFLSIMSIISSIIKFLIDLTIIDIPRPSVHEVSGEVNTTVLVNPRRLLMVGVLGLISAIILLAIITRSRLKKYDMTGYFLSKRFEEFSSEELVDKARYNISLLDLKEKDISKIILHAFSRVYSWGKELLGIGESITPRELAYLYDVKGLSDKVWVISSAFEELKYGKRIPSWVNVNDILGALRDVEVKIREWSSKK